ncbi:MAG: substrate-binding domain-containing protein [Alcanivoracaceae bacterium]|nr:substrate-binding domain-containing protein [Alcanivoracaceae bacterium]
MEVKGRFSLILFVALFLAAPAWGQGLIFAMAGKSVDDFNFVTAWQGCQQEAEKHGDSCIHIGPSGPSHFRAQDEAITAALLSTPLNGLAVSVTNAEWLSTHSLNYAKQQAIPVITFDSDLSSQFRHLRHGYIGADNNAIGRRLASLARELRPQGGRICLMSAVPHDENLSARVDAVRDALSDQALPVGKRLEGPVWLESSRCPLYNWDNEERALSQLHAALKEQQTDIFISVGAWPVIDAIKFRQTIQASPPPQKHTHSPAILIAIGAPIAAQKELLDDEYVDAFVSIDFFEIGVRSYQHMKALHDGAPIPSETYTEVKVLK